MMLLTNTSAGRRLAARWCRVPLTLASVLALSACSITMPATQVESHSPAQWQAPLPHDGALADLSNWWQRQGDPVLLALIEAAQAVSPSVAQALSRIEAARASQVGAAAALLPRVDASVSASRGVNQPNVAAASTLQAGLQATWELDLVGANRAVEHAANAQLAGTQALWHDARVSVAAEVANAYFGLSTCTAQLAVARQDAGSRQASAGLSELSARAGFTAPGVAAMARASAAEARSRVTQQAGQCDLETKALVALTGLGEPALRAKLATAPASKLALAPILLTGVPAQTVAQRPDVFAAERDLVLASAQVGSAKAQRYPRLTLNGSIGGLRHESMGVSSDLSTWSFGPLALSVPLFDGGQRQANVITAQARYTEAVTLYRAKVRQAVREVEEALVNLHSTAARAQDTDLASRGYAQSLAATDTRYRQGLASLVELEDARRLALAAQSAQLALTLERQRAWVALYRALGGGFEPVRVSALASSAS